MRKSKVMESGDSLSAGVWVFNVCVAGTFEETSSGWHYRKDDGNYARSEWVLDQGAY